MVMSQDLTADQGSDGIFDISALFNQVTVLGLLGTLCFVAGYELTVRRRWRGTRAQPSSTAFPIDRDGFRAFALAACSLGVGLFLLHLELGGGVVQSLRLLVAGRSGGVTEQTLSSSEYLSAAPILIACVAIVLVAVRGTQMTRPEKAAAFIAALVPAVLALLLGNRRFVIPSVVIPVVVYYLAAGRRPSFSRLVVLVPIIFIILSTLVFARSSGARQQSGGVAPIFAEAFARPVDSWRTFIGGHDTAMVAWLGVEIESINSGATSHTYGKAVFGDLLLAPIPSQIVPGKPITARDGLLVDIFGGRCVEGSCPDFSAIGTFYQDFAYPGVILGMFLLGAGAARAWRHFLSAPNDPRAMALAAAVAVFVPIVIRAGFMPGVAWFLYFVVPSAVGLHFAVLRSNCVGAREVARVSES